MLRGFVADASLSQQLRSTSQPAHWSLSMPATTASLNLAHLRRRMLAKLAHPPIHVVSVQHEGVIHYGVAYRFDGVKVVLFRDIGHFEEVQLTSSEKNVPQDGYRAHLQSILEHRFPKKPVKRIDLNASIEMEAAPRVPRRPLPVDMLTAPTQPTTQHGRLKTYLGHGTDSRGRRVG